MCPDTSTANAPRAAAGQLYMVVSWGRSRVSFLQRELEGMAAATHAPPPQSPLPRPLLPALSRHVTPLSGGDGGTAGAGVAGGGGAAEVRLGHGDAGNAGVCVCVCVCVCECVCLFIL